MPSLEEGGRAYCRIATMRSIQAFDLVLDGTPLLDIKPYVEGFDLRVGTRGGRTKQVGAEMFTRRGRRQPKVR